MARYGVPYRGSKSRIARWVVENLPSGDVLVDLFAGGCAVTHCAMLSGKWGRFVVNDVSDAPQLFIDAANGMYANETRIPTREEFLAQKDDDPYIRYLFSFGNNGRDYLFAKDVEEVKVCAGKMLVAPTLAERYRLYHRFIRLLGHDCRDWAMHELESCERIQTCERLLSLQCLQGLQGLQSLQSLQGDYRSVPIPDGAVVYCDPPYRGTDCGCYGDFDFEAFDAWLAECEHMCIVSEYTAPTGCVEVASREKHCSAAANNKSRRVTERLFVHESQLETYERMIGAVYAESA
jgi:hypothetical protein